MRRLGLKIRRSQRRGFSMVELFAAVAILMLMLGLTAPWFSGVNESRIHSAIVRGLIADLRAARIAGASGRKVNGNNPSVRAQLRFLGGSSPPFYRYEIGVFDSTGTYQAVKLVDISTMYPGTKSQFVPQGNLRRIEFLRDGSARGLDGSGAPGSPGFAMAIDIKNTANLDRNIEVSGVGLPVLK